MLFIYPSIILLLFLCIKSVSTSSLARYFAPKKLDHTEANTILKKYQHLWPSDTLNCESLREHLEAGKNDKVKLALGKLDGDQLDSVLDVTLYPSCSDKMLHNFKLVTFSFLEVCLRVAFSHIFIHQIWNWTKELIGENDNSSNTTIYVQAAGLLTFKACKHRQFALIKTIFDAIAPEHLHEAVGIILSIIFEKNTYDFISLYKLCILNDPEKYFTVEMFRMMERIDRSALAGNKKSQTLRVSAPFDHPFAESQIFARAINLLLSDKTRPFSITDMMDMAGASDVPALKQYLSKDVQKRFLKHFGIETTDYLNSAWSKVVLKRKDRHEEWYKKHAIPILLKLQQLNDFLLPVLYSLIAEYAAT